jgi:hypothetical protein
MADPLLDAKVIAIGRALDEAALPHAFGGALALAWYGVPRATEDIDLNLFVTSRDAARALAALTPLGVTGTAPPGPSATQAVWRWGHTPIHVFFAYDPFHESCRKRARRVPFADGEIASLGAEDLAIFKLVYDREKDRSEVREVMLCMGERLDQGYMRRWLERILGAGDERVERFVSWTRG